jgi:tRNA pseudouridine55 synthase
MMNKHAGTKINGILLLDKPLEMTSNGALQRVKRLFGAKKAGHTGSLDPLATGMLPICFGEATKLSQYLLDSDKCYSVTGTLGIRTATGDAEGEVIATRDIVDVTRERLEQVFQQFIGQIDQIPPMFSAIKFQGQPLYKLARRGIEIERQPRPVTIHSLKLIDCTENTFKIDVHCTKGTYIRTLVEDIGEVLGCGAHVSELRRPAVSPYQDSKMYTLEELEAICNQDGQRALLSCLLPLESSVQSFPAIQLSTSAAFYLRMGQPVMATSVLSNGLIRLFSQDGQFMGIGEMMDDGRVTPRRLFDFPKGVAEAG